MLSTLLCYSSNWSMLWQHSKCTTMNAILFKLLPFIFNDGGSLTAWLDDWLVGWLTDSQVSQGPTGWMAAWNITKESCEWSALVWPLLEKQPLIWFAQIHSTPCPLSDFLLHYLSIYLRRQCLLFFLYCIARPFCCRMTQVFLIGNKLIVCLPTNMMMMIMMWPKHSPLPLWPKNQ